MSLWKCIGALTIVLIMFISAPNAAELPGPVAGGYLLPNGWRITPVGKAVPTEDLVLNLLPSPDGRVVVGVTCGYNPHGLVVVDVKTDEPVQRIPLPTAWLGLAWHPDGTKLYVSGGNNSSKEGIRAPVYVFGYKDGRLTEQPLATLSDEIRPEQIFWSGLAHHPTKNVLFAANRTANQVAVFDSATGKLIGRIPTEQNPYDVALSSDGKTLYCSNWGSDTVSVIDTEMSKVAATISVGDNPNDIALSEDGRLFVCCSNDNTVVVIDTSKGRAVETIVTSLYPRAPEGSTPNALAFDPSERTLYVANADNNNVCVVDVAEPGESTVLGFLPTGWYPSAVAVEPEGKKLYVGNGKGIASSASPLGPNTPGRLATDPSNSIKTLTKGSINIVDIARYRPSLRDLTKQAYENCPYDDEMLAAARPPRIGPSVVPRLVGQGSPIKHVIYIIKENRTYDQVFGDMPQGNGDPELTIFGREITPNHHAIAEQFVLLDNLYCDAEVSWDGHQWSNAAYATDFTEKYWPAAYAGLSDAPISMASLPHSGYIWDQCFWKGLTYRSYGEFAERAKEGKPHWTERPANSLGMPMGEGGLMEPIVPVVSVLNGHIAPHYLCWDARDYENAAEFIREFDEYEKNYDSREPRKRLPNFIVMALPEDHTYGTSPGLPTPRACVASNDYGLGMIVDRVSHSKYWPETAIFVIEDDAQDGPDHVDARRTVGLVASPYCRRGIVDSTLYTTSSMLRTIELLLGLQPMSQYDAAATPMYTAFSDAPDATPYTHVEPLIDIHETNTATAWGADESLEMDFSTYDRCPMFALNEIIWKSVKGPESDMPVPIHRFQVASFGN